MGEKKTTLLEINIEDAGGFSFSPQLGGELGEKLEEYEEKGSKLGLFGTEEETVEDDADADEESGGLFSRDADDEAETEDAEADETEVEVEDAEESDDSGGSLGLVIGLLFLLVVAVVAKKAVGGGEPEEYEEVELSEYEN